MAATVEAPVNDSWQKYIDILTQTLNQQKERDISAMDSRLAARGIGQGGAYAAGQTDISGKYANALANTLAQVGLEREKINQAQNFDLSKQERDFANEKLKYFGYQDPQKTGRVPITSFTPSRPMNSGFAYSSVI